MLIYEFYIVDGVEITTPDPDISGDTSPLWSLPLAGTRIDRGTLSQGLTDEFATHFILAGMNRILNVVVPNSEDQPPRLIEMMEFNRQGLTTSVIGFEKAFIQHVNQWGSRLGSVSRLSFAWGGRELRSIDPWPAGSCVCVFSKDYPTTCNGARLPKFDEESGRIVQDSMEGIRILDTALIYQEDRGSQ